MIRSRTFDRSRELSERAHRLIPAGCHTYSKADDQFPILAPGFIERGEGARVWDVDGNRYLDWGMGLRSVILGHGDRAVLDAVSAQLARGSNFTRPAPIEVELAELITRLIPCAEMVKFAKNGSDVTSAAVRLARAFTGRDGVALCRENPFFSFYDWFIGTTPCDSGVPRPVSRLSLPFHYNDIASLEKLFADHPAAIACVILEPATTEAPRDGFLERARALCDEHGALLIFDEMITGFRWDLRGAQHFYGVTPDLATFGKAIGNGFSAAVLAGRREIMELGGIRHAQRKVFLLSATHGAETHSLVAAAETIRQLEARDGVRRNRETGERLVAGFNAAAAAAGVADHVAMTGYPCSPLVVCRDAEGEVSLEFRTLFLQETIARGVLMPWVSISLAHGAEEVDETLLACTDAFAVYRRALKQGIGRYLEGPAVKPVFRRFN